MTRELREALEQIRYVEKIYADRRTIQRETDAINRKLRRDMSGATCAIPFMALARIAVLVLTDAVRLVIVMLWITAILAVTLWTIHRLDRVTRDGRHGDDPADR